MRTTEVLNRQLECRLKEIEKHLDSSFDNINNFIDQTFIIDSPMCKQNNSKVELFLPQVPQFNLIGQTEFQSNIVQQLKPLFYSKIQDQIIIKLATLIIINIIIIIITNIIIINLISILIQIKTIYLSVNNKEDIIITSSNDKTIKFWIKQNEWICQQTITDHKDRVSQLSLNEKQNKVISCGNDQLILVIEYSEQNKKWMVIQNIKVDCQGYRICFINDNQFTFQPKTDNLMRVYEMNIVSKQFTKTKDIIVNQGNDNGGLFPQQYIKSKQLLVGKHDKCVNLIRKSENDEFKVEQSIQFASISIYGQMSDDGEYLITWESSSKEIQIRKYTEQ